MSLRVPIAAIFLAAASAAAQTPQVSAPAAPSAPQHKSRVLFFYTSPRSTVEMEVHSVPATTAARLARLRENFAAAGCSGPDMREQPVHGKHGDGTNLVCTWPGGPSGHARGTIVVAAHYDHSGPGSGALDDWSGAVLLPFLYQAIQGQLRDNNFVFLEAWKRDGAHSWLHSLPRGQRKNIRAMIYLDALGLSFTRFYTTFHAFENPPPGSAHLQITLLWSAVVLGFTQAPEDTPPRHWLTQDLTDPFRAFLIPTLVVHSVPRDSDRLPGSVHDLPSAIDGNAYFRTYHLMCAFLASLDRVAARLGHDEPFWTHPPADVRYQSASPIVTFMKPGGIMKKP
jgi:hypothetical protein